MNDPVPLGQLAKRGPFHRSDVALRHIVFPAAYARREWHATRQAVNLAQQEFCLSVAGTMMVLRYHVSTQALFYKR